MQAAPTVFDRDAVRRHRDRAARDYSSFEFLLRDVGASLADRLDDIKRSFPLALDLGCHTGQLANCVAGHGGIQTVISSDLSEEMARRAGGSAVVADEEFLPFAAGRFDIVLSCLSLHWVNDLPGALLQIRQALKPDGLLLATMFGGETLRELRGSLLTAEMNLEGGASPRVSPFVDLRDAGDLLQRAGFALPVADVRTLTVSYSDPLKLMHDLRGMGEANAVMTRRRNFSRRATLAGAVETYLTDYAGDDGRVPASFEIVTLTAWAPHSSQQQPLRPGSGTTSLADALGSEELDGGDPAKP